MAESRALIRRVDDAIVRQGQGKLLLERGVSDGLRALSQVLMGLPPDSGRDWNVVLDLARQHEVASLLFWRLEQEPEDRDRENTIPAEVREGLQRDFYVAAARAMVAERRLEGVLGALEAAGVQALVIKGPTLASLYPDPALRPYGDLDVLVPRTRLDDAEGALRELGYHCSYSRAWSLEYGYDVPMVADDGRSVVEIHWRLDYPEGVGHLPVQDLWGRAVPWTVGGQAALQLEAVDMMLYLCSHAVVGHRAQLGLRPLCDLAQIVDQWESAEWKLLAHRAVDYGLVRPVYLMLILAEQVLGLALPAEVMSALRPPDSAPLPSNLAALLLESPATQAIHVPIAAVQAGAKKTLLGRLRHLLWHVFLPRDGMAVVYRVPADSPLIWLTYLRRPVDLLRRYGRAVWSALLGQGAAQVAWEREAWLERWLTAETPTDKGA